MKHDKHITIGKECFKQTFLYWLKMTWIFVTYIPEDETNLNQNHFLGWLAN